MQLLALVVSIRKGLGKSEGIKGDLVEIVKSVLRKLIASKAVVYALPSRVGARQEVHS